MVNLYLITGFLGAGKTTFIKNILSSFEKEKTALVINEFSDKGVDGNLLSEDNLLLEEINSGSILCQCKADTFIKALIHLKNLNVKNIIVEGSGLTDPSGISKILNILDELEPKSFIYKNSICLVDSKNFYDALDSFKLVENQITHSHIIILNKIDLITSTELEQLKEEIEKMNPSAKIYTSTFSKLDNPLNIINTELSENISFQHKNLHKILGANNLKITVDFNSMENFNLWIHTWLKSSLRSKGIVKIANNFYFFSSSFEEFFLDKVDNFELEHILVIIFPNKDKIKNLILTSYKTLGGI